MTTKRIIKAFKRFLGDDAPPRPLCPYCKTTIEPGDSWVDSGCGKAHLRCAYPNIRAERKGAW